VAITSRFVELSKLVNLSGINRSDSAWFKSPERHGHPAAGVSGFLRNPVLPDEVRDVAGRK